MRKHANIYGNARWNTIHSSDSAPLSKGRMRDRISLEWGQDLDLVGELSFSTQWQDLPEGLFLLKGDRVKDMKGGDLMY